MNEKIKKPWGYEIIIHQNPYYIIKKIYVNKGHRLSEQYHNQKYETWIFPDGRMRHIKPREIHRLEAKNKNLSIIEISSPHLKDVVRLKDDYGRI
jgi:mannose-6-phosphate isomerase-like protein (cupin superfamily)